MTLRETLDIIKAGIKSSRGDYVNNIRIQVYPLRRGYTQVVIKDLTSRFVIAKFTVNAVITLKAVKNSRAISPRCAYRVITSGMHKIPINDQYFISSLPSKEDKYTSFIITFGKQSYAVDKLFSWIDQIIDYSGGDHNG